MWEGGKRGHDGAEPSDEVLRNVGESQDSLQFLDSVRSGPLGHGLHLTVIHHHALLPTDIPQEGNFQNSHFPPFLDRNH